VRRQYSLLALTLVTLTLGFVGCGGGGGGGSSSTPVTLASAAPSSPATTSPVAPGSKIKHVVIVVQENRSFDNLFQGYPGADTVAQGLTHTGQMVALHPASLAAPYDIDHGLITYVAAYDGGKMDGFDLGGSSNDSAPPDPQYAYVPASESSEYFQLAKHFVLADKMFASQLDSSFTAHQFLIAAQSGGTVDDPDQGPWGCDGPPSELEPTLNSNRTEGPGVFPCFTYPTLADEMDPRGITWRYYAPQIGKDFGGNSWTAFDAAKNIRYGPDWTTDEISPSSQFLTDVAGGALANVTWIIPDYVDSDHSGAKSTTGPSWVASLVNAVGESRFWNNTAVFVIWDDWGGWYDHVSPPQLDVQGLGFRVPMLAISPYSKVNYVSHVQYESAGILKFVESVFHLPALQAADRRANGFDDIFDFTKKPRAYSVTQAHTQAQHFVRAKPSLVPPDDD
jgi:phospholipase C